MTFDWRVKADIRQGWQNLERIARNEIYSRKIEEARRRNPNLTDNDIQRIRARRISASDLAEKMKGSMQMGEGPFKDIPDIATRWELLAQTISNEPRNSKWNDIAKNIQVILSPIEFESSLSLLLVEPDLATLGFAAPDYSLEEIKLLPSNSFFLRFKFTLAKPYISRDDAPFYMHENPIRKEWITRWPLISPSGWKGALRAALEMLSFNKEIIFHLVGNNTPTNNNPGGEESCRGRLIFFPTFFQKINVEIINPHSRKTNAGKNPIQIESVSNCDGIFALLYIPLSLTKPQNLPATLEVMRDEVLEDLKALGQSVYFMMVLQGFGAKTSSGMGRIDRKITGHWLCNATWFGQTGELGDMDQLTRLGELPNIRGENDG